ncbi:uncharacterized protein B0I36DRAFT_347837 [Microdochium trichocladiopsis]|uniref:Ysc84 actin-binding domain-containing protein n=1 Tax=Microdochium trichocladiopsis TaxID=1682393 RepID=A0A9P8YA84_9PEZI|nr:uncharacterized protein B0I36DRAFT_347837 [Microdochium trichocladiopsis]KAH7032654.1 hypothetical protein B0I36DRAFT_347837 [Microdochium trichocladiopsis]
MGQPAPASALPYPEHSCMPYIHSQDDDSDDTEQPVPIITATAMDLKWFTYTRTAPAEVEGLGIVAHPHPLRSHPCDDIISHSEYCRELADQERERIEAVQRLESQQSHWQDKQRLNSWPAETVHLVPAPLAPFGGIKRADSELGRRHQQQLTDLDEEMDESFSPLAYDDDGDDGGSIYEEQTGGSDDDSQLGGQGMRRRQTVSSSSVAPQMDSEEEEDEPVMILGTVRRESRRPSSLLRLQQEQAALHQYRRDWSPISTPPRSRANTVERKPSLVRAGTFGPTPPDTPPRMSSEPELDSSSSPPRFSTLNNGSAQRQSSILQNKQRLARAGTSSPGSRSQRQSIYEPAPPAYHDEPLLAIAASAVQRQQQQQQLERSEFVTPLSAPPPPRPPPKRKTSRTLAYAQFFAAPPDYWSGSGSSTPERVATPPLQISRVTSAPSVTAKPAIVRKPVPYFPPPPTAASAPPTTTSSSSATAGIFGPPKVVSPGPDGLPSAMHTVNPGLLTAPASSTTPSRKFGHRPISTSANKLKKLRLGENISKWTTNKVGEPINTIANKLGSEAFWPMTLDKECDKAARILRAFCCGEEAASSIFSFASEGKGKERADLSQRRPSHSAPAPIQIPPHVMASAKGLAIFTTFRAGGLHLSGARGSGVVIARLPSTESDVGRQWSPPSGFIVQSVGAGLRGGGGAGSEFNDCVFVLTTDAAVDAFTRPKLGLGSEIGVTPGPVLDEDGSADASKSRGHSQALSPAEAGGVHVRTMTSDVRIRAEEPILSYTRSTRGAWTGAKASGTIVAVRADANASFYGSAEPLSVERILSGQVPVPKPTRGPLAVDGTVMWAEGGSSLVRALQDIEGRT